MMIRSDVIRIFLSLVFSIVMTVVSKVNASQLDALNVEINKNPKNYRAYFNLAGILLDLKNYHGAAEKYQFLIDINEKVQLPVIEPFENTSQFLGRVHMGLGFALDFLNEDQKAIKELKKAVSIDPGLENHLMLQTTLGAIYGDLGLKEKELSQYQRVIEINPKFYRAYLNLAIALGETGKISQSITILERVIVIKPDYAKAYSQLGVAHEIMHNPKKAIKYYLIALKIYSNLNDEKPENEIKRRLERLYKVTGTPS